MPVKVEEDGQARPVKIRDGIQWLNVLSIEEKWDVDGVWADRTQAIQTFYRVVVESGGEVTVFRNHLTGQWCRQYPP